MLGIALISNSLRQLWSRSIRLSYQHQGHWIRLSLTITICLSIGSMLTSCREEAVASPRSIAVEQAWELDLGDVIEGFQVVASLGDVSVHVKGARIRAPFDGEVQLSADGENCIFFSSPEVPAYLFRFCGVRRAQIGVVEEGQSLGVADYLHFATMRRQPEGTWTIVEPSTSVLERSLQRY